MTNGFHRMTSFLATCGLAAAVAMTALLRTGGAQEAIPSPPVCVKQTECFDFRVDCPPPIAEDHLHRVVMNDQGQITVFITKLPALGQVFKDHDFNASCPGATCCEEMLERIGAKLSGQACEQSCAEHPTRFIVYSSPVAAGGACACGPDCVCGSDTAHHHSPDCQCCACTVNNKEAVCGADHCPAAAVAVRSDPHHDILAEHHPLKLLGHIANLVGEKAAAQAALEARREAHEELSELYETMAELIAANAALQARLEAQTEQAKLAEKLAHLTAENARLKTHVELAAERAEATRTALSVSAENDRLKLRLAELEHQQALAEAARTAQRGRAERRAR